MRKPYVSYSLDETITKFIRKVVGDSFQDRMVGSEILFCAGLASRELTLIDNQLTGIMCICCSRSRPVCQCRERCNI